MPALLVGSLSLFAWHICISGQGPGQATAMKVIEVGEGLMHRGNMVTVRWTPAQRGGRRLGQGSSGGHSRLGRPTLPARDKPRPHDGSNDRGQDPRHQDLDREPRLQTQRRQTLEGEQAPSEPQKRAKGLGQPVLPAPVGHAAMGAYLCNKMGKIPSDKCWWCDRDEM